jgi:hypothetical protein
MNATKTGTSTHPGEIAMAKIRKVFRKLLKKERQLARAAARVEKQIEREAYEWASMGY